MSLATWEDKYYPVPASAKMATEEAIAHSLRKWRGLGRKTLRRHGLSQSGRMIYSRTESLAIDANTCSLCKKFMRHVLEPCPGCPVYESRGRVRCDDQSKRAAEKCSPYDALLSEGDNEPMVTVFEKCLRWYREHPMTRTERANS